MCLRQNQIPVKRKGKNPYEFAWNSKNRELSLRMNDFGKIDRRQSRGRLEGSRIFVLMRRLANECSHMQYQFRGDLMLLRRGAKGYTICTRAEQM